MSCEALQVEVAVDSAQEQEKGFQILWRHPFHQRS
jgi:hypothetical protein